MLLLHLMPYCAPVTSLMPEEVSDTTASPQKAPSVRSIKRSADIYVWLWISGAISLLYSKLMGGWFFVTVCAHSQCISYKAACISITVILFACGTAVEIHSLNLKEQGSYFLPKTDKKKIQSRAYKCCGWMIGGIQMQASQLTVASSAFALFWYSVCVQSSVKRRAKGFLTFLFPLGNLRRGPREMICRNASNAQCNHECVAHTRHTCTTFLTVRAYITTTTITGISAKRKREKSTGWPLCDATRKCVKAVSGASYFSLIPASNTHYTGNSHSLLY